MKLIPPLLLGAAAALLAAPALAQGGHAPQDGYARPGLPPPPHVQGAAPGGAEESASGWGDMRARRQARLQQIRTALSLRPDQEGAFRSYLQAIRPDRATLERRRAERMRLATLTAPERLEARLARLPEHEAMLRRRLDATRRFYASLGPDQRRAFDQLRPGRMRRGMGGRGGPPPAG